jgi:murein hydrolase activator
VIRLRNALPTIVLGLLLLPAHLPAATPEKPDPAIAELGEIRLQCIAVAHRVQQDERAAAALDFAIGAMERGVAAKRRQFEENGSEEAQLLGALQRLARAPRAALAFPGERPIDRARSAILLAAAIPALETRAKALSADLASLAAEQARIKAGRPELEAAIKALAESRTALAALVGKRDALIAKLLPLAGKTQTIANLDELIGRIQTPDAALGDQASDLPDLIKRADTEADRRDKDLLARLRAAAPKGAPPPSDPTRPANLRGLDAPRTTLLWPAVGEIAHRFGEADTTGRVSQGLQLNTSPSALVVAPFDGEVEYAGNFRDYGLILIIRHGGGYHSLLAGLGRLDATGGQYLLAGEPVGAMPSADDGNPATMFYFELRRDGRPVDPQSRLAARE